MRAAAQGLKGERCSGKKRGKKLACFWPNSQENFEFLAF
jgi:hypothetical protein